MLQTTPNWQRRTLLFLISQCITLFGSTLVQMAIVWYVTLQTASGLWLAAFSVCSYLPQFLISFIGGVWADRYNRKRLIILSDGLIAAVTLLMYLIMPYLTNQPLLLGALLVMSVIRSLGAGVQTPAVNAVLPQLVPAGQLMRYNGLNAAMQSVVNFAAPAAAGAVLSISSLHTTLLIDVLTAALGIGLFSCLLIPSQAKQTAEPTDLWSDLKIGLNYAFKEPLIGRLLMIYGLFVLLCVPAGFMAGLLVSRIFGSDYWYLTAVELVGFAGMTLGGLLMSIWGGFSSRPAHAGKQPGLLRLAGNRAGHVSKLSALSAADVAFWHCPHLCANRSNHSHPGKCAGKHSRAHFWPDELYVCWFSAAWYGRFWPAGRYYASTMADGCFRPRIAWLRAVC